MTQKVGFLRNHEALHQVSHVAPIINSFAQKAPNAEVHIIASSQAQYDIPLLESCNKGVLVNPDKTLHSYGQDHDNMTIVSWS